LTPEEIGLKFVAFWGSISWLENPKWIMDIEKGYQAKFGNGYFEVIENTDEKVVYKARKNWLNFFGDEDHIQNVSRDDMTRVIKTKTQAIAMTRGWKFAWEDEGEELSKVTIEK